MNPSEVMRTHVAPPMTMGGVLLAVAGRVNPETPISLKFRNIP